MSLGIGGFSFRPGYNPAAERAAADAREAARGMRSEVVALQAEIERLLMITEALWTFLREQHGYTDEDLIKKIAEIDLRDGRLDGRVARTEAGIKHCPNCNRPVGRKRPTCLYCGAAIVQDPFER